MTQWRCFAGRCWWFFMGGLSCQVVIVEGVFSWFAAWMMMLWLVVCIWRLERSKIFAGRLGRKGRFRIWCLKIAHHHVEGEKLMTSGYILYHISIHVSIWMSGNTRCLFNALGAWCQHVSTSSAKLRGVITIKPLQNANLFVWRIRAFYSRLPMTPAQMLGFVVVSGGGKGQNLRFDWNTLSLYTVKNPKSWSGYNQGTHIQKPIGRCGFCPVVEPGNQCSLEHRPIQPMVLGYIKSYHYLRPF